MKRLYSFTRFNESNSSSKIIAYHVTNKKNLDSILLNGLEPRVPEDYGENGDDKGVYLFKSRIDMTTAVSSWLGERIEEWEEETGEEYEEIEIIVDITGLEMIDSVEFEWTVLENISPDRIIDVRDNVWSEEVRGESLLESVSIQPMYQKIYTQAEMVKMGGNYHLQHGILAMIPVEKVDGLDPEPGDWHDDEGTTRSFRPGVKIDKAIEVWYDELNDKFMLYDGNHRMKQAKTNGDVYIKAFVQANSRDIYNKLLGK